MVGQGSGSGRGRGRSGKHGLPSHTQAPPTTSTPPTSMAATTSTPPGRPPHVQEFVMIPNPGYMELGSQSSFPLQSTSQPTPSLHPPATYLVPLLPLPQAIWFARCTGLIVCPLTGLHDRALGA